MGKVAKGGVESMVFSYYTALDKSKFQYDIVYEDKSTYDIPNGIIEMGARAFKITSMSHPLAYISELRGIIKKGSYNIIHCNNNTLSVLPLIAAKSCGVKVRILHNHTTSSKAERKRDFLKRVLRLITPKLANKWCACSEAAGRWMYGDKAFDLGKVTVFRNAVDIDKFEYNECSSQDIRREFEIENNTVIGHVGRFVPVKNHLFLIDIFSEYRKINNNAVLLLVGEGPETDRVKAYVKRKGLDGSVIFAGARSDVAKFYSAFDIFLLPSLYEGLPVVSVEASAAGLAQLLSDKITEECRITDGVEFLPIDDPKRWALEIDKKLSFNRSFYAEQMRNSRYNINHCVKELEAFYGECLREV